MATGTAHPLIRQIRLGRIPNGGGDDDDEEGEGDEEECVPSAENAQRCRDRKREEESWKVHYEALQARLQKATAWKDDDSEKPPFNSSVKQVKKTATGASVPHYATSLEIVLRLVMHGLGSPIQAIEWCAESSRTAFE